MLIIVGTLNELYSQDVLIFENLGTSEKFMTSIVGKGHTMISNPKMVERTKHFAVAFFGTYLTEHEEFAEYFSEEFVSQYQDLVWGK